MFSRVALGWYPRPAELPENLRRAVLAHRIEDLRGLLVTQKPPAFGARGFAEPAFVGTGSRTVYRAGVCSPQLGEQVKKLDMPCFECGRLPSEVTPGTGYEVSITARGTGRGAVSVRVWCGDCAPQVLTEFGSATERSAERLQ